MDSDLIKRIITSSSKLGSFSNMIEYKKYIKYFIYLFVGYFFVAPLSFIFPKSKKIWIFGSGSGGFIDNSKYFYIWCFLNKKEIKSIWIAKSKKEIEIIRSYGYLAYHEKSFLGFYYRMRAKVFIFSSYLTDCGFFYAQKTFDVNLWHGVGIKKIERQIKTGASAKWYKKNTFNRVVLPHLFKEPDLFLVTSDHMANHFKEAFEISDEQLCFSGYPRLTLNFENKFLKEQKLFFNKYKNIILYAPTFRDDKSNKNPIFNLDYKEFSDLNDNLFSANNLLILKPHPNEKINIKNISKLNNIILWDNNLDIYEFKDFVSCLITDYSSIFYDFLYIGGVDLIMFPFDYESYLNNCRDMADDYFSNVSDKIIYDKDDFLKFISNYSNSIYENKNLFNKFWGSVEGKGNLEIFNSINKKISNKNNKYQ